MAREGGTNLFFPFLAMVRVWLSFPGRGWRGCAEGTEWIPWKKLTNLCGWLSWQVISSLQAQLAEAQSSQEAQLREELQREDQKVQHKALRVKEYEREVSAGVVLKVLPSPQVWGEL